MDGFRGIAYEPLLPVFFLVVLRVLGNRVRSLGVRRYSLIRVPNRGRIEIFPSDFDVSSPHAKLFTYTKSDVIAFQKMAVGYANFLSAK